MNNELRKYLFITFIFILIFSCSKDYSKDLIQAVYNNNYNKVQELVDQGANINIQDSSGDSLLHIAISYKDEKIAKYLIDKKINLEMKNKYGGTPLLWAIYNSESPKVKKIVFMIIDAGANLETKNNFGYSALPWAVKKDNVDIVSYLVEKKADINSLDKQGMTPLELTNNKDIIKILLNAGAKKSKDISTVSQLKPLTLSELKYPFKVNKMKIDNYNLSYIDQGKGRPIIFLHGVSMNLKSFNLLYDGFIKKGYRVIGLDLLGYYKSDKPNVQYSIQFHADTVMKLIKKLNLKDITLVGHSMGSAIALNIAYRYQTKLIKNLVLMTPAGLDNIPQNMISYLENNYDSQFGKKYVDDLAYEL